MRVLSPAHGPRGGVEPRAGLPARLRALGAEVRLCAAPDVTGNPVLWDQTAQRVNALAARR